MKEYVPPLEIAAESFMNNSGETVLTLYGDHGVPDIIVCDGKRYIQEPTVGIDELLDIARQMEWASEASYEEVGVVSGGIVGAWAEKIKEACGEVNNHEA